MPQKVLKSLENIKGSAQKKQRHRLSHYSRRGIPPKRNRNRCREPPTRREGTILAFCRLCADCADIQDVVPPDEGIPILILELAVDILLGLADEHVSERSFGRAKIPRLASAGADESPQKVGSLGRQDRQGRHENPWHASLV